VSGPVAVLIGPPGAGKSTVGPLLAGKLGVPFTDADRVIEETAGKLVSDIFVQDGEAAFRALEQAAAARLIGGQPGVLALGGGAPLDPATRQLLAGQRVIYLETGLRAVVHRSGLDGPHPPMPGNPRGRLKQMLDERHPVYAGLAWRTVATDDRDPEDLAGFLAAELGEQQP
jgi:shikimate kinase